MFLDDVRLRLRSTTRVTRTRIVHYAGSARVDATNYKYKDMLPAVFIFVLP